MRVILTRPEREGREWQRDLESHGMEVVALPLLAIHPLADDTALQDAWKLLGRNAAVMFVSAAAVEHFLAARRPGDIGLGVPGAPRAWVTGPGSASALDRLGVPAAGIEAPPADSPQFDSEALWQTVSAGVHAGQRVLIVRGADIPLHADGASTEPPPPAGTGRDWLARRLDLAGAHVDFLVAYERRQVTLDDRQARLARQSATDGSVWLFTSTQAIAGLRRCLPAQDWSAARALATHARIAQAARAAGFGVVRESRPGVEGVLASIESIA